MPIERPKPFEQTEGPAAGASKPPVPDVSLPADAIEEDREPALLAPQPPSLTRQTLTGVRLVAGLAILTKALSLLVTIVVGWLLVPEDFGLAAAAIGLLSLVAIVRDAGASRLLLQKAEQYERLARPMLQLSLAANTLAAIVLVAAGLAMERGFGMEHAHPGAAWLAAILALAVVMRSPVVVWRARLQAQMQFPTLARMDLIGLFIQYTLTIVLAMLGLGAKALILPQVAVAAWEIFRLRTLVGATPGGRITRPLLGEIFATVRWIMLIAAGGALVNSGDYLALAFFEISEDLGVYFFGFQISVAVAVVFTASLDGVLMPAFVQARGDPARLARAYRRAIGLAAVVIAAVAIGAAVAAPAAVHGIWRGKWDAAIPIAVLMFISLSVRGQATAYAGVLEALGYWRLRAALAVSEGVGMFIIAAVAAWLGDIVTVAICVACWRLITGINFALAGSMAAGVRAADLLADTLPPVLVALASGAAAWSVWQLTDLVPTSLAGGGAAVGVYVVVWFALSAVVQRQRVLEAVEALRGRV